ncbi:MAG: hypothetical protein QM811_17095 [Pirellulales bacterium]
MEFLKTWIGAAISSAVLLCTLCDGRVASAQRAGSSSILPRDTLAYVRITNVPEFAQKFMNTGTGRMLKDPQMQPLVQTLYGQASDVLGEVKEKIGLSLDELLKIPAGEIAFATIAVTRVDPDGKAAPQPGTPALALIIDTGANAANARKLLETIEPQVRNLRKREETIEGQKVVVFETNGPEIHLFERDGTFVFCTVAETTGELIKNWNGREKDSFNDNPRYAAVMAACKTKNADPNLVWYVEPIKLVRASLAGNFQAQVGLAVLPALGLDGLQAVGGTLAFDVDEFDYLGHAHVLLDTPRSGVIDVLKLGHGDLKPQPWVANDVASYMTLYWDFRDSFANLERLIDSFQGPGKTAENIKRNISDKLEVDVITEILPLLAGRVTMLTRMPKAGDVLPKANAENAGGNVRLTATFGRQAEMLFAVDLTDVKKAEGILDRLLNKPDIGGKVEKKSWAGHTYYAIIPRSRPICSPTCRRDRVPVSRWRTIVC